MSINDTAMAFFEACETGKGWEACNSFCHPEATFSSQTGVLEDIYALEGYCERGEEPFYPDARRALRA